MDSPDEMLESHGSCLPGALVDGRYLVEHLAVTGGMAAVFRATHVLLGRPVALKVLSSEFVENAEIVGRFLLEARAASQLESRHATEVFDVGTIATGAPYLAMEWLEGSDLECISARERLSVEVIVDYVLQACEALAEVHARGIVHRDIKPANLFVTTAADGRPLVKLLDFGVSKIASSKEGWGSLGVVGTTSYMAPEQMSASDDVDARADIWALGVVMFELLTGELPFEGASLAETLSSIVLKKRLSPSEKGEGIPKELDDIIDKCLSLDRERRHSSVTDLAMALAPFATSYAQARADTVARIAERARERPIEAFAMPGDEQWIEAVATPRPTPAVSLMPPRRLVLIGDSEPDQLSDLAAPQASTRPNLHPTPLARRPRQTFRRMVAVGIAIAAFSTEVPDGFVRVARSMIVQRAPLFSVSD
jgi:serine/threonine protein kinase